MRESLTPRTTSPRRAAVARRAEEPFPAEPVRTLDAIHLASALVLRGAFSDLCIATADERLRANAALLGLPAAAAPR